VGKTALLERFQQDLRNARWSWGACDGLFTPPLSADAVRALADGSDLEAAALYELTGGNPFYVTEVLRAGTAEVPASARDA
jgi:hypothetical protein